MSLFSDNIRHLRNKIEVSQAFVAEKLIITRDRFAKYEAGKSQPPFEILVKISRFYHVSIDILLTTDIRKIDFEKLLKLDDNRILLPITVDSFGENMIEIIPHNARAGYLHGYSDPEFIENLQSISLPFLKNGKFRAFPVSGDSMPPHKDGSFIVGKYIENLGDVRDGKTYILLTKNDGIVYKRLNKNGKNNLVLKSDNDFYKPYQIKASEILEIWEFACSIATTEFDARELPPENLREILQGIRTEIKDLKFNQ
ncbi:helix-turn-helix domain-containing protein [Flavobacterium sp. NST-5]|uniref:Helix-turn-helix domain-containing protein n=1 Tax=Flavobacterium ichthyis TaxID=2698827 RepID=A0ABW9ZA15_9FLAO|nr:LexA family transcriptional regulator [Flavobacterium ichthyis]NBL65710.1 helix-turn-helix domain-containing protein [Flavobacterium ichthyis]